MEKMIGVLVFLFIVISPLASALGTDLKAEYSQGETVVAKISGSVLEPINADNIEFKRNNVRVPFSYDIKKLGDGKYYIWFVTPMTGSSNYTIFINRVSTIINGAVEKIDFSQNFSVVNVTSNYYIEPGFVMTREDFQVDVFLNGDEEIGIDINYPYEYSKILSQGKNTINFPISGVYGTAFVFIKIGKYNFPAYIIKNDSIIIKSKYVDVLPHIIDSIKSFNDTTDYQFFVRNAWEDKIDNLYVQYNEDIFSVTPEDYKDLKINESITYTIQIKNKSKDISEIIYIKSEENNFSYSMNVYISFVRNASEINYSRENVSEGTELYTCRELLGEVCSAQQECNGEISASRDGICCLGTCSFTQEESSAWVGYLIAALVLVGLFFIYFKYKGVKTDKNPLNKLIKDEKSKPVP